MSETTQKRRRSLKRCSRIFAVSMLGVFLLFLAACGNGSLNGQTNTQPSIVGSWDGGCNSLYYLGAFDTADFRSDGTASLDGLIVAYQTYGDKVQITANNNTVELSYSLSGDGNQLTLADAKGGACVLGLTGSNATQTVAQALIGVWNGPCPNGMGMITQLSKVEFKSNGNAVFFANDSTASTDNTVPSPYNVPSPGRIVFDLGHGDSRVWVIRLSGSTLLARLYYIGQDPETCTLNKSS